MNTSLYHKIDDYLNGNLTGDNLQAFEQALATDEALAHEVEVFRLERKGVELLVEQDLRQKMQNWRAQNTVTSERDGTQADKGGGKSTPSINQWFLLVAFITLVLGFLIWFLNKKEDPIKQQPNKEAPTELPQPQKQELDINPNPKPDIVETKKQNMNTSKDENADLALAFYEKPNLLNEERRGENNDEKDPLKAVIEAWKKEDYKTVVTLTQQFDKNSAVYIRSLELQAHAYFALKNYPTAENIFSNIAKSDSSIIGEQAEWYQLLCNIAFGNRIKASSLLDKILKDNYHNKNEAAQKLRVVWK